MGQSVRQTNWCVITGAPCSGKTAVIKEMQRRGFAVVHEVARACIDRQLQQGLSLAEIRADELKFESAILAEKVRLESGLPENETIFFDRGLPDSIAYFKLAGLDPAEPLAKSRLVRYRRVFFFERLPFSKDRVRAEDEKTALRLDLLIEESYRVLGYHPIQVPLLPVKERADFILRRL